MCVKRPLFVLVLCAIPSFSATFGSVVDHTPPFVDLLLDGTRQQLYGLDVGTSVTPPKVTFYNVALKSPALVSGVSSIAVGLGATSMAMSPTGSYLYVACYQDGTLDIIDLTKRTLVNTINLPAKPEAVAVGSDGKVLISTVGTSTGQSVLMTYDPSAASTSTALQSIVIAPTAPTVPATATAGVADYLSPHARLAASADGKTIVGVHEQASTRVVFVYSVASGTVLRSRTLTGLSPILAVSADGSRFISGQTMIESQSMTVLAQQSATNAPFLVTTGANFSTQTNQGGAVFSADGTALYTAYNIVPVLSPTAETNTSQIWVNTPTNMLIQLGIQMPEDLSGKLAISADGTAIYGISQSGFIVLNVGAVKNSPIAIPDSNVALLLDDQCGVNAAQNSAVIPVRNQGAGAMTVGAQVNTSSTTSTTVTEASKSYGGDVTASFSAAAAKSLGTSAPDQLLLQSSQAVNVIPSIRVFQNDRNAEAAGTILPVDVGGVNPTGGTATGLTDMIEDTSRLRLYIANAGMNRIEIYDMQQKAFLPPVSVGQLPRALAMGLDGNTLYVANSGGEYLSIVDLNKMAVSGTVELPPQPFNSTFSVITPQLIASSQAGPQVVMSNGTLWKIVNGVMTPRTLNPLVFGSATSVAAQSMASTPEGAYVVLLATSGIAYLYSAAVDDFVQEQQVVSTPITGYFGPVAAGPNGAYFAIGGQLYNSSLTLISNNGGSTTTTGPIVIGGPGLPSPTPTLTTRPVSAVAAVGAQSYAQFSTPIRASASTAVTDAGIIQIIDVTSQKTTASINALEGPIQQVTGAARVSSNGRTMAFDPSGTTAYALTESGLSVLPVSTGGAAAPSFSAAGVTNTANYQAHIAPVGLISIFGKNLAAAATAAGTPLPDILGGTCVTFNNAPIPLIASSAGQINAQVPTTLAAGNYPVVIRSIANNVASSSATVAVAKYAPAVFVDADGPAIFHANGQRVDQSHPAVRDEELTIYATGLGVTTGGRVTTGIPSPSSPLAVTSPVQVFFGNPTISDSGVIVDWSGLVPGSIGLYQINGRVPGTHLSGNALPVTVRIGGISSPVTGPNVAVVYVN
jgi:uncharacterized protein (TIGR03437 family)